MMSLNSVHHVGGNLKRCGSMSEKIDSFLESVKDQQRQILEDQRTRRLSTSTLLRPHTARSFMSSGRRTTTPSLTSVQASTNVSVAASRRRMQKVPPSTPVSAPPLSIRRSLSSASFRHQTQPNKRSMTKSPKAADIGQVAPKVVNSKLRQDRNYQPPRAKKKVASRAGSRLSGSQQFGAKNDVIRGRSDEDLDEYDYDEEEEDEEKELYMAERRAWLYDQAIRGRMRQRAASQINRWHNQDVIGKHEKESSKDSAYGLSGGETSRHQTREPTPDTPFAKSPSSRYILQILECMSSFSYAKGNQS